MHLDNTENPGVTRRPLALSISEAASELSVSPGYLRQQIKAGRIRAARLGRRVVLEDCELRRFLKEATEER